MPETSVLTLHPCYWNRWPTCTKSRCNQDCKAGGNRGPLPETQWRSYDWKYVQVLTSYTQRGIALNMFDDSIYSTTVDMKYLYLLRRVLEPFDCFFKTISCKLLFAASGFLLGGEKPIGSDTGKHQIRPKNSFWTISAIIPLTVLHTMSGAIWFLLRLICNHVGLT